MSAGTRKKSQVSIFFICLICSREEKKENKKREKNKGKENQHKSRKKVKISLLRFRMTVMHSESQTF